MFFSLSNFFVGFFGKSKAPKIHSEFENYSITWTSLRIAFPCFLLKFQISIHASNIFFIISMAGVCALFVFITFSGCELGSCATSFSTFTPWLPLTYGVIRGNCRLNRKNIRMFIFFTYVLLSVTHSLIGNKIGKEGNCFLFLFFFLDLKILFFLLGNSFFIRKLSKFFFY